MSGALVLLLARLLNISLSATDDSQLVQCLHGEEVEGGYKLLRSYILFLTPLPITVCSVYFRVSELYASL